jgi:hypothetical protein
LTALDFCGVLEKYIQKTRDRELYIQVWEFFVRQFIYLV